MFSKNNGTKKLNSRFTKMTGKVRTSICDKYYKKQKMLLKLQRSHFTHAVFLFVYNVEELKLIVKFNILFIFLTAHKKSSGKLQVQSQH